MALKDLVADISKLTEAAIEEIVLHYVRYDPNSYEVVLTPTGLTLSNESKILVLLVAIAGWQYVVDEVRQVDTRPSALEKMTGISGGTLRPTLKRLKDAHLVVVTSEGYAVRLTNLDAVGRMVAGNRAIPKPASRKSKLATSENDSEVNDGVTSLIEERKIKGRRKTTVPIRGSLARLIDTGFFIEERTLSQVVTRFHEMAIIAKTTSLSGPIAELVRGGKLARKKVSEHGKEVWSYRSA